MFPKHSLSSMLTKGKRILRRCLIFYENFLTMESFSQLKRLHLPRFDIVEPGKVSPANAVPDNIVKPYYCREAIKQPGTRPILKTKEDLRIMRSTCSLAKRMLDAAGNFIEEGVTTDELDKYIHNLIVKNSAYPSPLMYYGFPKSICTSVNNVACHGIPDNRKLLNGDVITVDVTVFRDGFHGDCAATFLVGSVSQDAKNLVTAARLVLNRAIDACRPGRQMSVIADAVTNCAVSRGFYVIPSVCGHGIGKDFHEFPEIMHSAYHLSEEDHKVVMVPGMTFTIEPILSEFTEQTVLLDDGWTVVADGVSMCAQFEHTILITESGAEVLTE